VIRQSVLPPSFLPAFLLSFLCVSLAAAAEPSLAEQMPRIPATSPAEALKQFQLQKGFELELVASEPDVVDPIAAAFDEDGRMYVVQMSDYPFLPDQRAPKYVAQRPETWGSIRLLVDTDDDGKMDKSTVFADKLRWPQSVACYKGGVFVLAPPQLLYLKDTNQDGVADLREEWATGFSQSNVQGLANGFLWGLDHGLWFPSGRAGGSVKFKDGTEFTPGRRDLRLDPLREKLELVSGGEQFGHGVDDFGNRFVCNNSNHIEHVVFPSNYLDRNPHFVPPPVLRSIAAEGSAALVFRISPPEPWRVIRTARRAADPAFASRAPQTELVATGYFTSATGITIYRGDAYPPEYFGNAFIGDVGGNLVHRKKLEPKGVSFSAIRQEENCEFIASPDNWFRPVNFINAPDGTLYVLDMYRETIEHPFSIPDDIKENVDLESGYDRGRIYRLVSPDWNRPKTPKLSAASIPQLVAALESGKSWVRETAHRLLWERQDKSAIAPLRALVENGATPQSRIHALWSLQGLEALSADDCLVALRDPDASVREQAVKLSEPFAAESVEIRTRWLDLLTEDAPRVRWQVAFSLGELDSPEAVEGLLKCAAYFPKEPDLVPAVMSSLANHGGAMARLAVERNVGGSGFQLELARLLGTLPPSPDVAPWLKMIIAPDFAASRRLNLLVAFSDGLSRRGESLVQVAERAGEQDALAALFAGAVEQATAEGASLAERQQALGLLQFAPEDVVAKLVDDLLVSSTGPELQQAVVRASAKHRTPEMANRLLAPWRGLGPTAKKDVVDVLLQSESGARALLASVESQSVKAAELERDKRQVLLKHPNAEVRHLAEKLLADPASANRRAVVETFKKSLDLAGDATRGEAVYAKTCAQCHRAAGKGFLVGPDMQSVQNKSPEDLLIAILDPNREAQPSFISYTAVTLQGQVLSGLVAAESAASLTLRRAEAREDIVLRENLDELIATGQSLMPEGVEKDITPQQMADLIAFIKQAPAGK
jgi:putative membrane-bound dehydrogenase-like protein